MLRTNSKQARENIRKYILEHFNPYGYDKEPVTTWPEAAKFILEVFLEEKPVVNTRVWIPEYMRFKDWAQGLPTVLDTCYYYNRSAVMDLAGILEETPEESCKYTENQAEERLTYLIYRELLKGAEQK